MHHMNNTIDKDKDFSTKKFVSYQDELKGIWKENVAVTQSIVLDAETEEADEQLPRHLQGLQSRYKLRECLQEISVRSRVRVRSIMTHIAPEFMMIYSE